MKISADIVHANLLKLPQVVFEVTDACNLRCKYCAYSDLYGGYEPRLNSKLDFRIGCQVMEYLRSFWSERKDPALKYPLIIGFYGGEPLLNFDFIKQMVQYVEENPFQDREVIFNMTTNAILLDRYMDFLVGKSFRLLISLDGDYTAQSLRVDAAAANSFDRVMANVNLLREKYPEFFDRNVNFNSVLHKMNSVESIHNFFQNTFGKEPAIAPLNTSGIRPEKREEFIQTYNNYAESISASPNCESLKEQLFIKNPETNEILDYIFFKSGNVFNSYNDLLFGFGDNYTAETGTCTPFSKKMFITVNGKILQCERISHAYSCGVVDSEGVHLDLEEVSRQHNHYTSLLTNQCSKCANNRSCSQCVYQLDSLNTPKPFCAGFSTGKMIDDRNMHTLDYLSRHPYLYERIINNVIVQ